MRLISFSMTIPQFKARTKDVTRRLGWGNLRPGDVLMAVEKAQGLKKGEKVRKLGRIRVKSVSRESISLMMLYGRHECRREGFPEKSPRQFVQFFCKANACKPTRLITRIEYEYLD